MKKIILFILFASVWLSKIYAQEFDANNAIKLFIDQEYIAKVNDSLSPPLVKRLYTKTIQMVNQTGIADVGYSTFLLTPKLDVLTVSSDDAGTGRLYLAECELSLSISRIDYGNAGAASYASFAKKIFGSGTSKSGAVSNAVNNIAANDTGIVAFLKRSKGRIEAYFQANCAQVVKEADRASELKEYGKAIALYFSIPSSAKKCYDTAFKKSIGIYTKFIDDQCDVQLLKLKGIIAMAETSNAKTSSEHYNAALKILSEMNPASVKCFSEAKLVIGKIEKRFDEKQKRAWELESKKVANAAELQKEMIKAMAKISSNYQPAGGTVIIKP